MAARTPAKTKAKARAETNRQRAEANGKPKAIEWHGITLDLPDELPGEIAFAYGDLEHDDSIGGLVKFLTVLLGEGNVAKVRAKVAEEGIPFSAMPATLDELAGDVFKVYGTSAGES